MTTHFPQEIFKNILSYCDDTIERKQRQLWKTIKPVRCQNIHSCDCQDHGKVDRICIGFIDNKSNKRNWVIDYDNWELDQDEGGCLIDILEDETTWFNLRESGNINNLS